MRKDQFAGAARAASMITCATSAGFESIGTWLVGSATVFFAFIAFANFLSRPGGVMRSLVATMYQLGFVFQAAFVSFAPRAAPLLGPWAAASPMRSAPGGSRARLAPAPFFVSFRNRAPSRRA